MMGVIIIAVAVLVGWIIFKRYTKDRIQLGIDFCVKTEELLEIYNEFEEIEKQEGVYNLTGSYFVVEYDSSKLSEFFMQMEYALALLYDEYDLLATMEYDFTPEDWDYIQEWRTKLQGMENKVRYEKWRHGCK